MNPKNKKLTDIKDNNFFVFSSISLIILLSDQLIKFLITKNISLNQTIPIISNIFQLTYIQNTGAGFGLFQNSTRLLIWFSIIAVGIIFYFYNAFSKDKYIRIFMAFILGGTLGNLFDRIRLGYVIDFLDFRIWPAFNIADAAITVGVIGLIIYLIKEEYLK